MNRRDFQALAEARLADAETLLKNRRFDGAYYLAGYVIECALKACIAKKFRRYDIPDKKLVQKIYTHDLTNLLVDAGLEETFDLECHRDPALVVKWIIVTSWSGESRYQSHGQKKAKDMLDAVAGQSGVLACIKRFW